MSLGIAFKGAEGIVLAADSRVTLNNVVDIPGASPTAPQKAMIPATFDNATKLINVKCQSHVGAVTYGAASIGQTAPRTVASFLPEFEDELSKLGKKRLTVEEFAQKLGEFFLAQWNDAKMPNPAPAGGEMVFLVGGYDPDAPYGRVFTLSIPNAAKPVEFSAGVFGAAWGGQTQFTERLLKGFDPGIAQHVYATLNVPPSQQNAVKLTQELSRRLAIPIPWQFLPLQDCIDLCIFLIRTTAQLQTWLVTLRGVGGAIDVATITRTEGFRVVQIKELRGDPFAAY